MGVDRPTISKIKSLATEQSFERGCEYHDDGSVLSASITHDTINGLVEGTENYRVKISKRFEDTDYYCTCPYDYGGICKHTVALLLHVSKNFKQMKRDAKAREEAIENLFSNLSDEKLREFLKNEIEQNMELEKRFIRYFEKDCDIPATDYKYEIDSLYRNAIRGTGQVGYGYEIDFDEFIDAAKLQEKNGDYSKAFEIYRAISESISDHMDYVDDSDGYYGDCFSDVILSMTSCITAQILLHREKRTYISYMFEKFVKNDPDYLAEHYLPALYRICASRDDYVYWKGLLEPHLPNKIPHKKYRSAHYRAEEKISLLIYILRKLRDKSVESVYISHYTHSETICLAYIKHMKRHNPKKIPEIIRKGLKSHSDSVRLKDIALSTYHKSDRQYREVALELYLDTFESKYYDLLKSLPGWKKTFAKITARLAKDKSHSVLIEVYLTEKMNAKALGLVISSKNLDTLSEYQKRLGHLYPDEYFEAYRSLILKFADSRVGRSHYKETRSYLKQIKKIPKHRSEFCGIVDTLKKRHSKKPAFITQLKNI